MDRRRPTAAAEFEKEFTAYVECKEPLYKGPTGAEEPFKTVALDPLSFWSLAEINRIQFINNTVDKKMNWDEYDILKKRGYDLLRRGMRVVEERGAHFVATCHVMTEKDEDTGQIWFWPDMEGSVRKELGAWFDAVVYLKAEKKPNGDREYQMHTVGERRERARLRIPSALHARIKAVDVPDFTAVQQRLMASVQSQEVATTTDGKEVTTA